MIEVPVHNDGGERVDALSVDEGLLGGEVRPRLLKQAYVRFHANKRQGTFATQNRGEVSYSGKKLYRQKGTGNARRGDRTANILRGGATAHPKRPKSWRQGMPKRMRRLANRNAVLAKIVDEELKLVDGLAFETPSTKRFAGILAGLGLDRSCLVALPDPRDATGRSAANVEQVTLTRLDRLNAFDILNHRYLVAPREAFRAWLEVGVARCGAYVAEGS